MGDIKSVGLYSGKWTPKSNSDLGDPTGSGGPWHDSSEWIRKANLKSTPLSKRLATLGDKWFQFGLYGCYYRDQTIIYLHTTRMK